MFEHAALQRLISSRLTADHGARKCASSSFCVLTHEAASSLHTFNVVSLSPERMYWKQSASLPLPDGVRVLWVRPGSVQMDREPPQVDGVHTYAVCTCANLWRRWDCCCMHFLCRHQHASTNAHQCTPGRWAYNTVRCLKLQLALKGFLCTWAAARAAHAWGGFPTCCRLFDADWHALWFPVMSAASCMSVQVDVAAVCGAEKHLCNTWMAQVQPSSART
jgi:hypothetical protein